MSHLVSGITGAAPMWHDIMIQLLQNSSDSIVIPDGVVSEQCRGKRLILCQGLRIKRIVLQYQYPQLLKVNGDL